MEPNIFKFLQEKALHFMGPIIFNCSDFRSFYGITLSIILPIMLFQLIRGCALRVLSSIRVPIIAPILLQGIKEASADMSPYVRKTAAHAIPKLAETDESCHDELIEIISRLLGDKELVKRLDCTGPLFC